MTDDKSHSKTELLLPWYVNNTLTAEEKQQVERYLETCEEGRDDLAIFRNLPSQEVEAKQSDVDKAWAKLSMQIDQDAEANTVINHQHDKPNNVFSLKRWQPTFSPAIAASLVAIVAFMGGMQFINTTSENNDYRTLSSQTDKPAQQVLRVVFTQEVAEADILRIIKNHSLTIIDGPSEAGVYTLSCEQNTSKVCSENTLAHLREETSIAFAEIQN